MAVNDAVATIAYATDGVSVAYAVPFYFKAFGDLVVMFKDVTGAVVTKILTTDYLVSGSVDPKLNIYKNGGTVTFNVALAASGQVRISRRTPKVQASVYVNGDPFPVEAHEVSLDTHTLVQQEAGPFLFEADGPPTAGSFNERDMVKNAAAAPGGSLGWIYLSGHWYEAGTIASIAAG